MVNNRINALLLVLVAVILSITLGGNGCLWLGKADNGDALTGSSGTTTAANPYPGHGTPDVATNVILSWSSVSGMTSYNIYFGTTTPPDFAKNERNTAYRSRYTPGILEPETIYHWRVDCLNAAGSVESVGADWTFKTKSATYKIVNVSPTSGSINIPIEKTTLSWTIEPSIEGITYKVYFGTNSTSTLSEPIKYDYSETTYELETDLSYNNCYFWKISATVAGQQISSPVWYFHTKTTLQQAILPYPIIGAENVALNVQLSWASSAGATKYDVYFRESVTPVDELDEADYKKTERKTVFRTRWTPIGLQLGKTYYWRIDALNDINESIEGDVWSFSTKPNLPDPVEAIYPLSTHTPDIRNLYLQWKESTTGATSYDVYFSSGGETTNLTYRANTTKTTYYPGVLKYNTIYKWKINPRNATGVRPAEEVWSFTTVTQDPPPKATDPYPPDNTTTKYPKTIQLSWLSHSEAKTYDVYMGFTDDDLTLVAENLPKAVYRTRYTPSGNFALDYETLYFWKVVAKNDSPTPAPADVWQFRTIPERPDQVENISPGDAAMDCPINQPIEWKFALRATSYDVYLGKVASAEALTGAHFKKNIPLQTGVTEYSYTPSPLLTYDSDYFWRIDARNTTGVQKGVTWSFHTYRKPADFAYISPDDTAKDVLKTDSLKWNTSARADSYYVYLSDDLEKVQQGQALIADTGTDTSYDLSNYGGFQWGKTFHWRIDAKNAAGTTAGAVRSFTTVFAPEKVQSPPVFPGDNDINVSINPILEWVPAAWAWSYDIYIDTNNPPTIKAGNAISPIVVYVPTTLNPGTLYYWRVDSKNPAATKEGDVWSFTVLPRPGKAIMSYPGDTDNNIPITSTLSWVAGSNTDSFKVFFGEISPGVFKTDTTNLTYSPNLLKSGTTYYWHIHSINKSDITIGDFWSFTTVLPDNLTFIQPPTDTTADDVFTVKVKVQDKFTNIMEGVSVSIAIVDDIDDILIGALTQVSDSDGIAAFNDLAIRDAGIGYKLKAFAGTIEQESGAFNITHGAAKKLDWNISAPPTSPQVAGVPWTPFEIMLYDQYDNFCNTDSATYVTVEKLTGSQVLGGDVTIQAVSGVVAFSNIAYTKAEAITVRGISGSLIDTPSSDSIVIKPASAASMEFIVQPLDIDAGAAFSPPVAVELCDSFGNKAATSLNPISISVSGGAELLGTTTDVIPAEGVAVFTSVFVGGTAGPDYYLTAVSADLVSVNSSKFAIRFGSAAKLTFIQQPSNVQAGAIMNIKVESRDIYNNPRTGAGDLISISLNKGSFATGTMSKTTDSVGIASFNDLSINAVDTEYQIQAVYLSITADSDLFNVTPADIDRFIVTGIPSLVAAGTKTSPVIAAYDRFNNIKTDYLGTIEFASDDPQAVVPNGYTFEIADAGIHTFNAGGGEVILKTVGNWYVRVTGDSKTGQQSDIVVTADEAAKLIWGTEPNPSQLVDAPWAPATISIAITDLYGNPVINASNTVTIIRSSGASGTFTNNSVDAVNGLATFANISYSGEGTIRVKGISDDGLIATLDSNPINVSTPIEAEWTQTLFSIGEFTNTVATAGATDVILEKVLNWEQRTDNPSSRYQHAMAYDSNRQVTVIFGGTGGSAYYNDTWEWNGSIWTQRNPTTSPTAREGHKMAYDSNTQRVVLFGGYTEISPYSTNETWEWNGINWEQKATGAVTKPTPRSYHAMVYNSLRQMSFIFGGNVSYNQNWEWDGTSWTELTLSSPSNRRYHAMAYDSERNVTVLFGGSTTTYNNETWVCNGTSWTEVATGAVNKPSARYYHNMAYDSVRKVTILFGGDTGSANNETWQWDGTSWTQLNPTTLPSARYNHAMAFDTVRQRIVLFGGSAGGNETWEWDGNNWINRTPPAPRKDHAIAYDSTRQEIVLFGGYLSTSSTTNNETWIWDGTTWIQKAIGGTAGVDKPAARSEHSMAYDPERQVTVLFGGNTGSVNGETWEWNGSANGAAGIWTQKATGGTAGVDKPAARRDYSMAYDPVKKVTVLFGGFTTTYANDTWEWDGSIWAKRAADPTARKDHAIAYDSTRQEIVLFGGYTTVNTGETWIWDGTIWTQKAIAGTAGVDKPSARSGHKMAYDSNRQRTILFGGNDGANKLNDTWEWNGVEWKGPFAAPTSPYALNVREKHAMAFHTAQNVIIMCGGWLDISNRYNDTWTYTPDATFGNAGTWNKVPISGFSIRYGHTMSYDSNKQRTILFGGSYTSTTSLQDVYELRWSGTAWEWSTFAQPATKPAIRREHGMLFDSGAGVTVVFGGVTGSSTKNQTTWTYTTDGTWNNAGVWSDVTPGTSPSARYAHAMAYDAERSQTILFGGYVSAVNGETWIWNGSAWTQRSVPTSPVARRNHAMAYDPVRSVMVLFGGYLSASPNYNNETWEWDGLTWTQRNPTDSPVACDAHTMTYDTVSQRIILFGGRTASNVYNNQTWEWDGAGANGTWTQRSPVATPSARGYHAMTYDSVRRKVVLFGGNGYPGSNVYYNDIWEWDSSYFSSGVYVSNAIAPTGLYSWGALTFTADVPAGADFTVSVLRTSDNAVLASNVPSGANLAVYGVTGTTSIKLRGNFSTNVLATPTLSEWRVIYYYLP